jgi:hypothetical protein
MKKVLFTLLFVVLALGLFAAVGFAGYRFGYAQGARATANGDVVRPQIGPFGDLGPNRMPMREFGFHRGFHRGFGMGGFPGMGFGFFALFRLLVPLAVLALIAWLVYSLFTRSGYRITRTVQTTTTQSPPTASETKETEPTSED